MSCSGSLKIKNSAASHSAVSIREVNRDQKKFFTLQHEAFQVSNCTANVCLFISADDS
jgi:hypothetical protein